MIVETIAALKLGDVVVNIVSDHLSAALASKLAERKISRSVHANALKVFAEDLTRIALDDEELRQNPEGWKADLMRFLKDEQVQGEFARPFLAERSEVRLNEVLLRERWRQTVGEDLLGKRDWLRILQDYVRAAHSAMLAETTLAERRAIQLQAGSVSHSDAPDGVDIGRYHRVYRELRGFLELSPMGSEDIETAERPIAVTAIYFPTHARLSVPRRDIPREYLRMIAAKPDDALEAHPSQDWGSAERIPLRNLISQLNGKHLVVLGDPGAGKSMVVRDLALRCLQRLDGYETPVPDWFAQFDGALPLVIELRHYIEIRHNGECECFLSYLDFLGANRNYGLTEDGLRIWLKDKPVLLLLDGLDEVLDPKARNDLLDEAISFGSSYEGVRVVLTSRIHGYVPEKLRNAGFEHLTLDELSPEERREFTDRWFSHAYADPELAHDRASRVHRALGYSGSFRAICGNPLLLTMACLVARHRELPRDRWGLFHAMMRTLVYRWDHNRFGDVELIPGVVLHDDEKIELLTTIAREISGEKDLLTSNVIAEPRLKKICIAWLEEEFSLSPDRARAAIELLLEQLRTRNFVLCHQGPGLWGFMHRTFLEWCIANGIASDFTEHRKIGIDDLKRLASEHWREPAWQEVLRLLAGRLQPPFASVVIDAVCDAVGGNLEKEEKYITAAHFAAELLAESLIPTKMSNVAKRYRQAMISGMSIDFDAAAIWISTGEALSRLPSSLSISDDCWEIDFYPSNGFSYIPICSKMMQQFARVFSSYRKDIHESFVSSTYCSDSWGAASWRSAWLIVHLSDESIAQTVNSGEGQILRKALLEQLGQLKIEAETIRDAVKSVAANDPEPDLRRTALQALGGSVQVPEVRAFLMARAADDPEPGPRGAALLALGDAVKEPEVRAFVMARAADDPEPGPRGTALQALGRAVEDSELRGFLMARAADDPEPEPRSAVLLALGRAVEAPEVRAFLMARAADDPEPGSRGAALRALGMAVEDSDIRGWLEERITTDFAGALHSYSPETLKLVLDKNDLIAISRDRDGFGPFLRPEARVSHEHIRAVAEKLHESEARVIERFNRLIADGWPFLLDGSDCATQEKAH